MTDKNTKERIEQLRRELEMHNYNYYVLDDPVISDGEYDKLFRELSELEENNPLLITENSPTQRVGAKPRDDFGSITHSIPLLSLANAMNEEELVDFDISLKRALGSDDQIETEGDHRNREQRLADHRSDRDPLDDDPEEGGDEDRQDRRE